VSYFNSEQEAYMAELAAMPLSKKCFCGWDLAGKCVNCNKDYPGLTCADKCLACMGVGKRHQMIDVVTRSASWQTCPDCQGTGQNGSRGWRMSQAVSAKRLWWATLSTASERYQDWFMILGTNDVPITTPGSGKTDLGPEKDVDVYLLDLAKLTAEQRSRLIDFIVARFNEPREVVERDLDQVGFPIRASDVLVAFDIRAFL